MAASALLPAALFAAMSSAVAICIVTYNSAADLPGCFAAIAAQDHRPLEVVIVDCASSDESVAVAGRAEMPGVPHRLIALAENRGFAGGMNEAFRHTAAPYLLTLNADVRPRPSYVRRLLEGFRVSPGMPIAAVTGRLVRPVDGGERRLDACGMFLTRTWRHLDRGSGEVDCGQWSEPQRVFGATGAATLFSREALADVALDGEVFDPAFHSFREDAELCFRLRERGWEVVYEPSAGAEHRRRVLPERRSSLPAAINYHSLKNRYLLRTYHQTATNFVRTLVPALGRDLAALAYVLLVERSSLAAYGWLWRHRRETLARRRRIQARRTEPPTAVDRWFSQRALPLDSER
ncbi:MAG: glycosyltransferase family 2 protein [bacterium]|nr:glycosyltransferase family 2 protein [bacterium]